jgi:hypothetical protein
VNRSTGAIPVPTFKDFCITIRLSDGWLCQEVIRETSPRFALGKVFGLIRKDGLKPADKDAVFFMKTADEMTADERWMWDVQNSDDEVAFARKQSERNREWFLPEE